MRFAALLEYDGSAFCGWQRQPGLPTVQAAVEAALSEVADQGVSVVVAGRTDTAVHARGQVIHFDTEAGRTPRSWVRGANTHLPPGVALLWAGAVAPEFHARFSAIGRCYRYYLLNRPTRTGLWSGKVSWDYRPLAVDRMQAAAGHLVGQHDFTSFRARQCQAKSPVRLIRRLEVVRHGDLVVITVAANAFLHHMVRNLVGVLATIGAGEQEPEWAAEVLAARDRALGGVTATPEGLYLQYVEYPDAAGVPGPGTLRSDAGFNSPVGSPLLD